MRRLLVELTVNWRTKFWRNALYIFVPSDLDSWP